MYFAPVAEFVNDNYTLRIGRNGLFCLIVEGLIVCDRGGMHEFLDLAHAAPAMKAIGAEHSGAFHADYHYLQHDHEATVEQTASNTFEVHGTLSLPRAVRIGGMSFQTTIVCHERHVELVAHRAYVSGYEHVGDNSLCFLSPPGFARRFLAYSDSREYSTRREGETWARIAAPDHAETAIPVRVRASVKGGQKSWGVVMGERVGFGLIVDPKTTPGELRCTRPPEPNADKKFDEVEFQWAWCRRGAEIVPWSSRRAGDVETGRFWLVPLRAAGEIIDAAKEVLG